MKKMSFIFLTLIVVLPLIACSQNKVTETKVTQTGETKIVDVTKRREDNKALAITDENFQIKNFENGLEFKEEREINIVAPTLKSKNIKKQDVVGWKNPFFINRFYIGNNDESHILHFRLIN